MNTCNICSLTFKSTSQYTGYKCKACSMSIHKECAKHVPSNCASPLVSPTWTNNNESTLPLQQTTTTYHQTVSANGSNIDTSIYSIQTGSSCSTTPNSHYSQNVHSFNTPQYVPTNQIASASYLPMKLDADIGSACGNNNLVILSLRNPF